MAASFLLLLGRSSVTDTTPAQPGGSIYEGGQIHFASTVIAFLSRWTYLDISSSVQSHGISLSPCVTLRTQMFTLFAQCTSNWKAVQMFGANSAPRHVLRLKLTQSARRSGWPVGGVRQGDAGRGRAKTKRWAGRFE